MLVNKTITGFSEELASKSPAPGGGSVAALAGSTAAALLAMVSNLTIGKEKFKEFDEDMQQVLKEAEKLRLRLLQLVDEDTRAFNEVMAAFKLSKGSEADKKMRATAIQQAFSGAARVPLEVANRSLDVMRLTEKVIANGNPNAASDAGVAVLMASAAAKGAAFNVEINLDSIKDGDITAQLKSSLEQTMDEINGLEQALLAEVKRKLA